MAGASGKAGACAAIYVVLALFSASLVGLFDALPEALITTIAGLALFGALAASLAGSLADEEHRITAIATFAMTVSGLTTFDIGAAFWGLCVGLAVHGLGQLRRRLGT